MTHEDLSNKNDMVKNLDQTTSNFFRVGSLVDEMTQEISLFMGKGATFQAGIFSRAGEMYGSDYVGEYPLYVVISPGALAEAGELGLFFSSTAPEGYLKCNGALVSRVTYADLFAVIGTTYGEGDGSTTFGLPDLRGCFLRGWDDGRGLDSGRVLGSYQSDSSLAHRHTFIPGRVDSDLKVVNDHTHSVNYSGKAFSSSSGAHSHTASSSHVHSYTVNSISGSVINYFSGSEVGLYNDTDNTSVSFFGGVSIQSDSGAHKHNVTISDTDLDITSPEHYHLVPARTFNSELNESDQESAPMNMALLACIKY